MTKNVKNLLKEKNKLHKNLLTKNLNATFYGKFKVLQVKQQTQ